MNKIQSLICPIIIISLIVLLGVLLIVINDNIKDFCYSQIKMNVSIDRVNNSIEEMNNQINKLK